MIAESTPPSHSLPLARREGLLVHNLYGECVVYDLAHDAVHYLNHTSRIIWERCDGHRTVNQIADELAVSFSNDTRPRLRGDVQQTIDDLARNGLLDFSR